MNDLSYSSAIGTPTFDLVRFSAPPPVIERIEVFAGGLYVFEYPRMQGVQAVNAPGTGGDVLIHVVDMMPRLDRTVASEMPVRTVRPRSQVLIPEGLATQWYAETGQPHCFHIHVPRALREAWGDDLGQGTLRPVINTSTAEIDALFGRIAAELRGDDPFRKLKLQGLAMAATAACYRLGGATPARPRSQAMTQARLRRVRTFVEENLAREVCLEEMAACVGLSVSHFARAFRAETGITPYAFVVQARIERVKDRLLGSRRSLAEIALDCGFASQSHMTETFRRATGLPPARWLRERGRGVGPQ